MKATIFTFIFLAFVPATMVLADRVNVTVYYESDCPFSRRFLVNQLGPSFPIIEDIVNVQLVPFGFADFIQNGDSWNFKCQHGLGECYGNKLHVCALNLNSLRDSIEFIGCMESAKDPIGSAQQCALNNELDWNEIDKCANTDLGSRLLHDNGLKTKSVKGIYGVPYIVVNGVHSAATDHQARRNLLGLVCRLYNGPQKKPSECRDSDRSIRSVEPSPAVIELGVFYESLCPYSKDFLVNQLYPSFMAVPEIFVADLVPFGHANFTPKAGSWIFQCQHGPQECIGNKIQACALYYYPNNNDTIPLIHCLESGPDPVSDAQQCAEQSGLDWHRIDQCYTTEFGSNLLHENGLITQNQSLISVPWITVNGVHTDENQSRAQLNLKGLLCDLYQGPKPPACTTESPRVIMNSL